MIGKKWTRIVPSDKHPVPLYLALLELLLHHRGDVLKKATAIVPTRPGNVFLPKEKPLAGKEIPLKHGVLIVQLWGSYT